MPLARHFADFPPIAGKVDTVPAPFAAELCGFREATKDGITVVTDLPNTSDQHDVQSVRLGRVMLRELGIKEGTVGSPNPGRDLEVLTIQHLQQLRPDLVIRRGRAVRHFIQYGHLGVTVDFLDLYTRSVAERPKLLDRIEAVDQEEQLFTRLPAFKQRQQAVKSLRSLLDGEVETFENFRDQLSREDLLKLDITLATDIGASLPELRVALSAKWTLRTDRGQDAVSQGSKLASQKRGRMPHFAVLTAEPRPAMLKIPSDGPSVDCIYHIDLPALDRALTALAAGNPGWSPKVTFDRLVRQGRLRDYDDLVQQVLEIPHPLEEAIPSTMTVAEEDA